MNRKARFSGLWYPDNPKALEQLVDTPAYKGQTYRFAILPHAGLSYSGDLIASFFRSLDPAVRKFIILAPSHYHGLQPGQLHTSDFTLSETPFGPVQTQFLNTQLSVVDNEAVADEHAVEMFLPFIAKRKAATVSYGLVSCISGLEEVERFVQALLPLVDEQTAVIASSDFTHYGRRFGYTPYLSDAPAKVVEHDLACAQLLADGDLGEVFDQYCGGTICGIAPAIIVSRLAARKGLVGHVDGHATSLSRGESSPDFVSYVTVFWR